MFLSLFLHGAVDNELGALSPTEGRLNRPRAIYRRWPPYRRSGRFSVKYAPNAHGWETEFKKHFNQQEGLIVMFVEIAKVGKQERPTVTSLDVAETFGKLHQHVLRDIRELGCS